MSIELAHDRCKERERVHISYVVDKYTGPKTRVNELENPKPKM